MKLKAIGLLGLITLVASLGTAAHAPRVTPPRTGCGATANGNPLDWSQFHFDACHTGYNPYETVLSPANVGKLVLAWRVGPESISSSPVVAAGVLYYGTANNGTVYALNARTGTLLWATPTMEDGATVTPAVAEGRVYVNVGRPFGGRKVVALNAANGKSLWSRDDLGFPSSVTVDGNVYEKASYQGLPPHTELHALDATTGGLLWRYFARFGDNFTAAIAGAIAYDGCDPGFCALDADTGVVQWDFSPPEGIPFYSAAVSNGVIYVGASYTGVRELFSTNMYALNATSGSLIWQSPITGEPMGTETLPFQGIPAVANDVLYVPTYEPYNSKHGYIHAIDARTGAHLWTYQTPGPINGSPAVANGVVYFGSDEMTIYAVDARTGVLLWKYTTAGPVSSPAVVNGMLYAADDRYVYAFHLPN